MVIKAVKKLGLLVLLGLMLVGCGKKSTTYTHNITVMVKDATLQNKISSYDKKIITEEAYEKLQNELEYMNGAPTLVVKVNYSGKDYNSLGKDFYDINVSGVIQNKTGNAEIFLFVDEKGKIIDVGAWWKTLG